MTPEQVERSPLNLPPKPRFPLWGYLLTALCGIAAGCAVYHARADRLLAVGGACIVFGLITLAFGLLVGKKQRRWEAQAETLRLQRSEELTAYTALYHAAEAAQADVNAKSATADALYASLTANEQAILLEIRRFAPSAFDLSTADQLLRECAVRRKALSDAETRASAARLRYEVQSQQQPAAEAPAAAEDAAPPPARSEAALSAALEALDRQQADVRSQTDRLTGQLAAVGDSAVLTARAEQLAGEIEALTDEYDAIALALETLSDANTALQNRFSPELGRRAAQIFAQLTGGRYTGVVLDKAFHLSAEPAGDTLYRDAQLLSAGALDQLYLAVRLAICELVLPAEKQVPLILDDALANFDDARCAAALDWLRQEAEHRQILLFTCHSREAAHFRGDAAVGIQILTAADSGV